MLCSGPNLYKLCITDEAQECESLGLHGALFCHCTEKYTKINALNYVALAVCEIAISPLCEVLLGRTILRPEVGPQKKYSEMRPEVGPQSDMRPEVGPHYEF